MKKIFYFGVLLFFFSCSNSKPENTLTFTRDTYIGEWPFSVDEVEVFCSGYKEIYCRTKNSKTYALNGSAKGASENNPTINSIDKIWLDDPKWTGLKIAYSDFIKEGLQLCEDKK